MSTSFPLPLECLQMVIHHLASQSDGNTLATMTDYRNSDTIHRQLQLARVLLLSLPSVSSSASNNNNNNNNNNNDNDDENNAIRHVTDDLKAAYLQDSNQSENNTDGPTKPASTTITITTSTFLPYYIFVASASCDTNVFSLEGLFRNEVLMDRPEFLAFLQQTGLKDWYLADEPFRRFIWGSRESIVVDAVAEALRRDFTWALCSNAEHIQILTISVSGVLRYLSIVRRFKVLSNIVFQLDRTLTNDLSGVDVMAVKEKEVLSRHQEGRARYLDEMVLFVQDHRRHHPNVLKVARCTNNRHFQERCPDEYHFRLLQLLPPLFKPQYLDYRNWAQFVANIAATDVSFVKMVCLKISGAVKERKDFESGIELQRPLVTLKEFIIKYDSPSFGSQLSDVLYAFNNTLETVHVRGFRPNNEDDHDHQTPSEFSIGMGHNDGDGKLLPLRCFDLRLSELWVNTNYIFLQIHPEFLIRCPRLRSVDLEDKRSQYSLEEVVHWEPADLPELDRLCLTGTPALAFHPETLRTTQSLTNLDLRMLFMGNYSFIPPPEEFDEAEQEETSGSESHDDDDDDITSTTIPLPRHPLPNLTDLTLTSEFAYRFQFRMLDKTPSLSYLSIDINSLSRAHKRTVGIADLVKPGYHHPAMMMDKDDDNDTKEAWKEFEYIHVPTLVKFFLDGPWNLDDRVLQILFSRVAPRTEKVYMVNCTGFSLVEWVDSTSRLLGALQEADATFSVTENPELIAEAGLVEIFDEGSYHTWTKYKLVDPAANRVADSPLPLYVFRSSDEL
ncbi:hypothetical protein BGX33_007748 [Mortierella sp. NVP41]|nr:hypothetical protein BGX33_007748 [Mortierella sp. NVP41]